MHHTKILFLRSAGIFLLILFATVFSSTASGKTLHYRLHRVWTRSFTPQIVDLNGDGTDELVIKHDTQIDVQDWKLRYFYHSFQIDLSVPYDVLAIPGTRMDSVTFIVSFYKPDTVFEKILPPTPLTQGKSIPKSQLKNFYYFVRSPKTPPSDFYQSLNYSISYETNHRKTIWLFKFNTGWDKWGKRGLLAADIRSSKILWHYFTGPQIRQVTPDDFNGDGNKELLVSTYAPANGVRGQDTSDEKSYIILLNSEGKEIWKRSLGGYWTGSYASVGRFNGVKTIVACQQSLRDSVSQQDKIFLIEPMTGRILLQKSIGNRLAVSPLLYQTIFCKDFNGDGQDEIVTGNTNGFVYMLDGSLSEIHTSKSYGHPITPAVIDDLNGDGMEEIVCYIPENELVVLDDSLHELCRYRFPVPSRTSISPIHANGKTYLLLSYVVNGANQSTVLEFEKSLVPFAISEVPKSRVTKLTGLFVLLLLVALFGYGKYRFDRQFLTLIAQNELSDKLLLLNKNRKIKYIGDQWAALFNTHFTQARGKRVDQFLQEPKLSPLKKGIVELLNGHKSESSIALLGPSSGADSFRLTIRYIPVSRLYSLMLFDTSEEEYLKQMKQWATIAQRLAHGIKNPLTAVKLNAEELAHFLKQKAPRQSKEASEYLNAITEQVDRLKRMSDGFMRFVEFRKTVLKPMNINELITDLVPQWFPGNSSKIHIEYDLAENLPKALLDEKQFEYAFRNIFFNAVESFDEKGGYIFISTRFVQIFQPESNFRGSSDYIELQVQDTGQGIPPDLLDKVTQPYVSSKPGGTGLGLSIVQRIMETHDGELRIDSQPGEMTIVTLRFRAEIGESV
ncbi:MAG: hypothetical protein GXO76_11010 [Calditrichaeota bacterium]|nr:hypothetical protein [Calditrichota bacterium]